MQTDFTTEQPAPMEALAPTPPKDPIEFCPAAACAAAIVRLEGFVAHVARLHEEAQLARSPDLMRQLEAIQDELILAADEARDRLAKVEAVSAAGAIAQLLAAIRDIRDLARLPRQALIAPLSICARTKSPVCNPALAAGDSLTYDFKISLKRSNGTDMYYNLFIDGVLVKEEEKGLVSDFDDITKYELVIDLAFKVRTIYVDSVTKELKETFKYNCSAEAEADLKHKNFEFNAKAINGTILLSKTDIVKEVKK